MFFSLFENNMLNVRRRSLSTIVPCLVGIPVLIRRHSLPDFIYKPPLLGILSSVYWLPSAQSSSPFCLLDSTISQTLYNSPPSLRILSSVSWLPSAQSSFPWLRSHATVRRMVVTARKSTVVHNNRMHSKIEHPKALNKRTR